MLGDPTQADTTLGPMVRTAAADFVRGQIGEAVGQGARALLDEAAFAASSAGTPYLAPQILVGVDHSMRIMREETFGPAVGIMKVASDEEAIALMNDSEFGLTAAIWTQRRRGGPADRRPARNRHRVHEPLRLPRPRAGLDRGEALRARRHALGARLRTPDATEVVSSSAGLDPDPQRPAP